ncbi:MAG: ribosome assembly RNA-binding protein YhbY [Myxococcales bacterium]|jgi:RNA-binding protein|nr:ribosome assembly RNA-binding protein YhbY [Myxococcales bacterium]
MALTGKQVRHLRSLGHALTPVVHIGKLGLTDAVSEAVDAALTTHELIKVRVDADAPSDRYESAEALAAALRCEVAQVIGNVVLLYRRHPNKPVITLPAAG